MDEIVRPEIQGQHDDYWLCDCIQGLSCPPTILVLGPECCVLSPECRVSDLPVALPAGRLVKTRRAGVP